MIPSNLVTLFIALDPSAVLAASRTAPGGDSPMVSTSIVANDARPALHHQYHAVETCDQVRAMRVLEEHGLLHRTW